MKRIAFLTHEPFYPPSGGGSAEAIYLIEEMVARGHEAHLFCPRIENASQIRERFKIHLHEFTLWKMGRYAPLRNFKYLAYPFFLKRMVEGVHRAGAPFDLIFSQHAIAAVSAGRLKQSLKVPTVMNFLDYLTAFMETWPPYVMPPPMVRALKRFELSLPRRYEADGVLTVSDTLAGYFRESGYPSEKILPIYFGFDSELFPFAGDQIQNATSPPVVVMHGSLDHHHMQTIGVEAVVAVARKMPEVTFRFVGHRTSALENFLTRVTARQPAAKIECTGFVPYTEVARHLGSATLGMVPYEESTGAHCAFVAKIVEYLAVGLPVVSTPLDSAMRYFKKEPTVRFTEFNGESFASAMIDALRAPYNLPAARKASERVRKELDWRAISRKAVEFAERTAGYRRP